MSQWISIKEKLPKQEIDGASADCIIAIKYKYDLPEEKRTLCAGYLLDNEWWAYQDHNCHKVGSGIYSGDIVTHWQLLPEPPK